MREGWLCQLSTLPQIFAYRSLARSFALLGSDKDALKYAKIALTYATKAKSIRDIGNSHLSIGEVYRYSGLHDLAIESYDEASGIASALGNIDSFLWAQLCKSDSYFLLGKLEQSDEVLISLTPYFEDDGSRHPIEFAHWVFSKNVNLYVGGDLEEEQLKLAGVPHAELNIDWPSRYIDFLISKDAPAPKRF